MTVSRLKTHDAYVWGVVEHLCTEIRTPCPETTLDVCAHPAPRGAIIDAHVSTDDDFAVLDLVNPAWDAWLLADGIAISVRGLGPSQRPACRAVEVLTGEHGEAGGTRPTPVESPESSRMWGFLHNP
jgi:hypothetical protein